MQQAVFKQIKSEDEATYYRFKATFLSTADAATVVLRLSTLSAHCFENTTSHVNFDIQRAKSCENVRDLE